MGRKPVSASSATCAQNARHSSNQAVPKLQGPPELRVEFTRWIVPQTVWRGSLFQIWQFDLRFDGKIKHALADSSVDRRACDVDVVLVVSAMQLDLVGQPYVIHRLVLVVEDFFLDAAHGCRILHDEVCLRIEEYLPLYSRRRGHLELQRVSSAHYRVYHKCQGDF